MLFIQNPFSNVFLGSSLIRLVELSCLFTIFFLFFPHHYRHKLFRSQGFRYFGFWLCILIVSLVVVFLGKIALLLLVASTTLLAIHKFIKWLCIPRFFRSIMIFNVVISSLTIVIAPSFFGALPFVYFLILIIASTLYRKKEALLSRITLTLFGSIWFIFSLFHLVRITYYPNGEKNLICLIFAIACSDSLAYVIRSRCKKHRQDRPFNISYIWSLMGNIIGAFLGLALFYTPDINLTPLQILALTVLTGSAVALGEWTLAAIKHTVLSSDDTNTSLIKTSALEWASKFLVPAVLVYWFFINVLS